MQRRCSPFLLLAVGASLILAGCGGGSAASSTTSASTSTTGASTANGSQADLRACLKKEGIDLPAGFGGGGQGGPPSGASGASGTPGSFPPGGTRGSLPGGVDQDKFRQAIQKCGGNRNGFPGGRGNAQAFTAYLSCLSDHGVTVPTSTSTSTSTSGSVGRPGGPGALNAVRNDPKFAAANKTCQALLPTAGSTTSTSG
jgi:hypothetical protein